MMRRTFGSDSKEAEKEARQFAAKVQREGGKVWAVAVTYLAHLTPPQQWAVEFDA